MLESLAFSNKTLFQLLKAEINSIVRNLSICRHWKSSERVRKDKHVSFLIWEHDLSVIVVMLFQAETLNLFKEEVLFTFICIVSELTLLFYRLSC